MIHALGLILFLNGALACRVLESGAPRERRSLKTSASAARKADKWARARAALEKLASAEGERRSKFLGISVKNQGLGGCKKVTKVNVSHLHGLVDKGETKLYRSVFLTYYSCILHLFQCLLLADTFDINSLLANANIDFRTFVWPFLKVSLTTQSASKIYNKSCHNKKGERGADTIMFSSS